MGALLSALAAVFRTGGTLCLVEFLARGVWHAKEVAATRTLAAVDQAMGSRRRSVRAGAHTIQVQGPIFGGAREVYGRNVYGARPGFDAEPGDVVVDLGANVGLFSVLAAKRGARVIAVEAQSGFIDEIHRHACLNGCADRITVELGLIAPGSGLLGDVHRLQSASHYMKPPPPLTMPDLRRRYGLERIDLLKVDIEGSEFGLLTGDVTWLAGVRRIAMEVHREFGDPAALARCLESHGFDVTLVDDAGAILPAITEASGYLFARRAP